MNTHSIPPFGLGTFRLKDQAVIDSVKNGLALGYRLVDTAQIYGNEAEVGQAIAESQVPRKELFITTKVWIANSAGDKLLPRSPHRRRPPICEATSRRKTCT